MENEIESIYKRHHFLHKLDRNDLIDILMGLMKMVLTKADAEGSMLMDIKYLVEYDKKNQ